MTAEVVAIYETPRDQIVRELLALAAVIEGETDKDDLTTALLMIRHHESGFVQMFSLGATNDLHSLGMLTLATNQAAQMIADNAD